MFFRRLPPEMGLQACCETMARNQISRVPIVDGSGVCCEMVSQADIAQHAPKHEAVELVREISQPVSERSRAS